MLIYLWIKTIPCGNLYNKPYLYTGIKANCFPANRLTITLNMNRLYSVAFVVYLNYINIYS